MEQEDLSLEFRKERKKRNMTQAQVAEKAGLSTRVIFQIERDIDKVGLLSVKSAVRVFGWRVNLIFIKV